MYVLRMEAGIGALSGIVSLVDESVYEFNAACGQLTGTYKEEPKEKQPKKAQTNKSMERAYAL